MNRLLQYHTFSYVQQEKCIALKCQLTVENVAFSLSGWEIKLLFIPNIKIAHKTIQRSCYHLIGEEQAKVVNKARRTDVKKSVG